MRAIRRPSPTCSTDLQLQPARRQKPERAPATAGALFIVKWLRGAWALRGQHGAIRTNGVGPDCVEIEFCVGQVCALKVQIAQVFL